MATSHSLLFSLFTTWAALTLPRKVEGSSIKMDFLPFADVRTDPIVVPDGLSDHVHTFYGATVARPETTYDDLINAYGGSGNVEENQSLYWHPTIYKVDPETGVKTRASMYIGSAYYIWQPGVAKAFPDGFKMIAYADPSVQQPEDTFPMEPMEELELEIAFPDCWDGVNIDSIDHTSHVAYSDADDVCPDTHRTKIPQIEFFFRVSPYEGGPHIFADGSTVIHADYFSGWNETELQAVLDSCDNGSFESAPDQFCEDFLTFKDLPKVSSACGTLESNLHKIQAFQPNKLDTSTITTEVIDNVVELPHGSRTGTLIPRGPGPVATLPPVPAPPVIPIPDCSDEEDEEGGDDEEEDGDGEDCEDDEEGGCEEDEEGDTEEDEECDDCEEEEEEKEEEEEEEECNEDEDGNCEEDDEECDDCEEEDEECVEDEDGNCEQEDEEDEDEDEECDDCEEEDDEE